MPLLTLQLFLPELQCDQRWGNGCVTHERGPWELVQLVRGPVSETLWVLLPKALRACGTHEKGNRFGFCLFTFKAGSFYLALVVLELIV